MAVEQLFAGLGVVGTGSSIRKHSYLQKPDLFDAPSPAEITPASRIHSPKLASIIVGVLALADRGEILLRCGHAVFASGPQARPRAFVFILFL
jgi:hypothetical protein